MKPIPDALTACEEARAMLLQGYSKLRVAEFLAEFIAHTQAAQAELRGASARARQAKGGAKAA
jgi:hypothetical protein